METITIRESTKADFDDVMNIERLAFGQEEEANLVSGLLVDSTAKPILSLLAFIDHRPVGHILFSRVSIENQVNFTLMHILAPLAVLPEFQRKGIGGKLILKGLKLIKEMRSELVFVLGDDNYYSKFGFIPNALKYGFTAPHPIPKEYENAWMYQALNKEKQNFTKGKIRCSEELNKPKYWEE